MKSRLLGALLLSLALHSPASAQQITLRVDATPSIFADMFKEVARSFEAQNPDIAITLDTSQRGQEDAFRNTLRKAIINDLPDVSFQGFNFIRPLSQAGHVLPLGQLMEDDPNWTPAAYSSSVTKVGTVGDKVFGLGVAFSFPVIFYNADLVGEANGGDKRLPGNWDAILSLAQTISARHPDILGAYTRYNSFMFYGHVLSGGGTLGNAEGTEVTFTDAKGMEVFRRFHRFGELGQAAVDLTDTQARQSFAGGRIAIFADSSSSLGNFQKQTQGRFEIAAAPMPIVKDGTLPTSGVAIVLHSRDSARQKAAWRFMRFVAGPEGQTIVGRMTGYVPANEVPIRTPHYLGDFYKANPAMGAALTSITYAAPWYEFKGPNTPRMDKIFVGELHQLVTLKKTPEETAAALAAAVTALIEK